MTLHRLTHLCADFVLVKLRLGALIPRSVGRSVGLSVGLSVCRSVCPPQNYKTLQNPTKHSRASKKGFCPFPSPICFVQTVKEASAICRSFLDGVVIFQLNNTYLFVIPFVLIVFNWRIFIFVQVCLNDIFNQKIFFSLQVHIMIFSLVEYSSLFKPMFVMFFDRRIFTSGVLLIFENLSLISF